MAKKKKKTTTKRAAKGKARTKKLSVKKRPVKDMDARQSKSVKGGVLGQPGAAVKVATGAVKLGGYPTVGDVYIKS